MRATLLLHSLADDVLDGTCLLQARAALTPLVRDSYDRIIFSGRKGLCAFDGSVETFYSQTSNTTMRYYLSKQPGDVLIVASTTGRLARWGDAATTLGYELKL